MSIQGFAANMDGSPPLRVPSKKTRHTAETVCRVFWWTRRGSEPLSSACADLTVICFAANKEGSPPSESQQRRKACNPQGVADLSFGGPEGDRTLEPHGCEPCALPAELRAHIPLGGMSSRRAQGISYSICVDLSREKSGFFELFSIYFILSLNCLSAATCPAG